MDADEMMTDRLTDMVWAAEVRLKDTENSMYGIGGAGAFRRATREEVDEAKARVEEACAALDEYLNRLYGTPTRTDSDARCSRFGLRHEL